MQGSRRNTVLTTSQVGTLLSVHPSTVKRWCDDGALETRRTGGGHRRIHLSDVLALAREREIPTFLDAFDPYQAHVWTAVEGAVRHDRFRRAHALALGWLARGRIGPLGRLFEVLGSHPDLPFPRFCDEGVRGFMERVGEDWRDGRITVGSEHLASQALQDALLRLRSRGLEDAAPAPGEEPRTALVGAMEGDQHHLGALCVRLLLEGRGWRVLYLGPDVPVEDLASTQRTFGADLVCVSFSPPATAADVQRCTRILTSFYGEDSPYALALGGSGSTEGAADALTGPFRQLAVFPSLGAFDEALAQGFGTAATPLEARA